MGKVYVGSSLNLGTFLNFKLCHSPPYFYRYLLITGTPSPTKMRCRWRSTIRMWNAYLSKRQTDWNTKKLVAQSQAIFNSLTKIMTILITESTSFSLITESTNFSLITESTSFSLRVNVMSQSDFSSKVKDQTKWDRLINRGDSCIETHNTFSNSTGRCEVAHK